MPLTSPIAHSRSPARRYSSTWMPRGLASTPTVSRPIPATRGRRPVATSSRSPRRSRGAVELQDVLVAVPPRGGWRASRAPARCRPGAGPRRAPGPAAPARGGSPGRRPRRAPTSPPSRRTTCAISTPADPPPSTSRRRGTAFMLVASRVPQTPSSSAQPRDAAARSDPTPVATTMCSAVWRAPSTSTTPVPASLPVPRSRSMPRLRQPALLAGVGVVRHHEVAPGQRGLDVDLRGRAGVARALHRLARAQQRLRRNAGPVGALAADQLALDDGDAQPARRQRRGAVLARRPAAEDDHVIVAADPIVASVGSW